jgi:hypothetical protein
LLHRKTAAIFGDKGSAPDLVKFAHLGETFGPFTGRYVIMPDHLHLFVSFDEERINLSRWTKGLKGSLSARFRQKRFDPPFWQKGFFDHVLRSAESYEQKWNYVRYNPVRAGLVLTWEHGHMPVKYST